MLHTISMPIIILKGSKQRLVDPSKTTRNSGQLRRKKPGPFFWVTAVVEESWMAFIRNLISIKVFLGKPQHPNALHHPRPPGSNGSDLGRSKGCKGYDGMPRRRAGRALTPGLW